MLGLNSSGYSWNGLRLRYWSSQAVIATADISCLWCDCMIEHIEFDKGLDVVE